MRCGASWKKKDEARNLPDPAPDKGDVYIWRCIDAISHLRIANHLSKTRDIDDAVTFLLKVKNRLSDGQILFTSDKLKSYKKAITLVFGVTGLKEGDPTEVPEDILYGQIDKERKHGRLVAIERKAVFGTLAQIQSVLESDGHSQVINTSTVERDNLSVRQHNGRLVRKTLSFSKDWQMHQAAIDFEDAVQNFVRPHSSLMVPQPGPGRRRWAYRTPAMAAGLTDHIWSILELVTYRRPSRE